MDIIDCAASTKPGSDLKEMTNKGLTDGEAHAITICAWDEAGEKIGKHCGERKRERTKLIK